MSLMHGQSLLAPRSRDLRVTKTYEALFAAFSELIVEKPFEQISVTELCERARTRRATFYKHFGDKYEFLHATAREYRRRFMDRALASVGEGDERSTIEAVVRSGIAFVDENYWLLSAYRRDNLLLSMLDMSGEDWAEVGHIVTRILPPGERDALGTVRGELRLRFIQGALAMSAIWWLEHRDVADREETIAEVVDLLSRL